MYLVNLFGGPGSGKSTSAAAIFAHLKNSGIRAELVHEAAKRFIYKGAKAQLGNQVYVMAKQWSHIFDLSKAGCEVAVSDSPLISNLMYMDQPGIFYQEELKDLTLKLDQAYPQINIFVKRTKHYDTFGRNQATVEEAAEYDTRTRRLLTELGKPINLEAEGNVDGQTKMGQFVVSYLIQSKCVGMFY
jgi:hypothetical protein